MNLKICVVLLIFGLLSFVPVVSFASNVNDFIDVSNYTINTVRDSFDDSQVSFYNESDDVNSTDSNSGEGNFQHYDSNINSSNNDNSSLSVENESSRISIIQNEIKGVLDYCNLGIIVDFCEDIFNMLFS